MIEILLVVYIGAGLAIGGFSLGYNWKLASDKFLRFADAFLVVFLWPVYLLRRPK